MKFGCFQKKNKKNKSKSKDSDYRCLAANKIQNLESEIRDIKLKNNQLQYRNKNLKSKNVELNQQNNDLQNEIGELNNQINDLESENKSLHELELEKNNYNSKAKKYKSKYKNLTCENIELDRLNNDLQNIINELKERLNNLESENNNCKLEIKKYKSEIEKLKGENITLIHSNNNLQNKTKELKNEVKNLESKNNKYELEIKVYQSENEKLESKRNELEELYKNLQNEIERLKNHTYNLKLENKSLKATNENLENFPKQPTNIQTAKKIDNRKPLGFANPKGYCYLNSVVQVLGSCCEFKTDIYNYKWISTDKTNDSIFVEGLFNLIKAINEYDRQNLEASLSIVQQNNTESSFGDDVYKCFMNLLTRVSNVIKTNADRPSDHFTSLPITLSEKAKNNFTRFKNRNPGFVFDNFYGQVTFQTVCKRCNHLCNESFQMIKSLPLPVPSSNSSETLNSCVDLFFNDSDVEVDEPMKCECESGSTMSLKSISKLTHGPKYLFIYLNRGSYTDDGVKNNTHVTCDDLIIHIKTLENQSVKYKLISVIDHVGDSAYGHYYCKCSFESKDWWLLNDSQVSLLKNKKEIVTKNTIVFLFTIFS